MVLRERSVPTLKVGLEQWNFTTVGVAEISPMNWAYYPFCGRGGKSPKHHKSPPGLECWNSSMMREAAGAVPLLKEKMLTPSFATEEEGEEVVGGAE